MGSKVSSSTRNMKMPDWGAGSDEFRRNDLGGNFRSIDGEFGTRGVNVMWKGAVPNVDSDDTAAFQEAVDYAVENKIGRVIIPSGVFTINGTVNVPIGMSIEGDFAPYTDESNIMNSKVGTIIKAGSGTIDPVFRFVRPDFAYGYPAGKMVKGARLANMAIVGSNHWNTVTNAVNRPAVAFTKVGTEFSIESVFITGFMRQGLYFEEVYDGTIFNTRILWTGTDGVYAALDYTGVDGNTNAVHAFGLHIEQCPFILNLDAASRHNQFIACKFEMYAANPVNSPIRIKNAIENTFIGCQFVSRSAIEAPYYDEVTRIQPHMILIESGMTTFDGGCMFTTPPGSQAGARWIKNSGGSVTVTTNTFNKVWVGGGAYPFILNKNDIFALNRIYSKVHNNTRNIMDLGSENMIGMNRFIDLDENIPVTNGSVFYVRGTGNKFSNNRIFGNYNKLLDGTPTNISNTFVDEMFPTILPLPDGSTTPSVGYNNQSASKTFKAANTNPTTITNFTDGQGGERITIIASNSNTTIQSNSTNVRCKSNQNVTIPFGGVIEFLFDGAVWFEVSRSF